MWFLYILLCSDQSLYTGITKDINKRFQDHLSGKGGKYTKSHPPLKVVYQEQLENHSQALKRELEIKSWSRTQKIDSLNLEIC